MIRMCLWADRQLVGWLGHQAGEFFLAYDSSWQTGGRGFALAPQFPLHQERHQGHTVRAFFENLLPEGQALDDVFAALQMREASWFELLGHLGRDLPGVLKLLPEGSAPDVQQAYAPLPLATLNQRLANRAQVPLLMTNVHGGMSLAGAQDKLAVRFNPRSHALSDSVGDSPTTHILKPDTRQARYQPSAINEFACMKLARAIKLPVPDVWLLRTPEAVLVVQRYDRTVDAGGQIQAVHQLDGCQLLGHGSAWKYQRMAGLVSVPLLAHALRALPVTGQDMLQLLRWVMFNYLIGNADAHAKNLSVLVTPTGHRLAPFYDLLCVRVYGDHGLALFIGDDDQFDAVGRHSWEALCEDCGFGLLPTLKEFRRMSQTLLPAWHKVLTPLLQSAHTTPAEVALLHRMTDCFTRQCAAGLSMTDAG